MPRIDYLNDPNAPEANSLVPSVTVVVRNDGGDILLVHRTDNDLWALAGGGMDLGESIIDAAIREVEEETGLKVEITGLVGIYTNPRHVMVYEDGEVRQEFSVCFTAGRVGGELGTSSETSEVKFVPVSALDIFRIHPSMRLRIEHALERRQTPYLG